jgi:hypothetical protein
VAVPVLCLVAAFSTDVGSWCASRARLQNTSDAASLAGVLELWDQRVAGVGEEAARAAAEAEAMELVHLNYPEAGASVTVGVWDGSVFTPAGTDVAANAVRVLSYRNASAPGGPDPTFFTGFIGQQGVEQEEAAVARFKHRGLVPFCVYEPDVGPPGTSLVLYNDTEVTPGVFGLLDYDGGENSANDQRDWTMDGFMGPMYIDPLVGNLIIPGCTGLKSMLESAIRYHLEEGDSVVACVYRSVWGTGANTYFEVVGFVELVITAIHMNHEDNPSDPEIEYVTAEVQAKYIVGDGETQGTMRDFMRLQLVD